MPSLGIILLAVWLIITGLSSIIKLEFEGKPVLMGLLAIAAGGLLLLSR